MTPSRKTVRRMYPPVHGRPHRKPEEEGFTIVEMAVSMLILSIFLVMFMTSMVHIFKPTLQTESMRDSSDQLDLAFLDLDSQVRYAYEIGSRTRVHRPPTTTGTSSTNRPSTALYTRLAQNFSTTTTLVNS